MPEGCLMLAWLGIKSINWKAVLIGLAALYIAGVVIAGYLYVSGLQQKALRLQSELATAQGQLNMARFERNIAEARAKNLADAAAEQSARLIEFQTIRNAAEDELQRLRSALTRFDLEKEISDDAQAARDRLNARTRELNRLLEGNSRF